VVRRNDDADGDDGADTIGIADAVVDEIAADSSAAVGYEA
jgi:hypothetical protein